MAEDKRVTIKLCMGSSCFARGNSNALVELESYIEDHNLSDKVVLEGHLCTGRCNEGPYVTINDKEYTGVSPDFILHLVEKALEE